MTDNPQTDSGVPVPSLELVAHVSVDVAGPVEVGETWRGRRRIIPILGGNVTGPILTGLILAGGADVQLIRPDGVTEVTARYAIRTPSGSTVFIENVGVRSADPEVMARLIAGEAVDPSLVYFRTVPRFETDDPALAWLERDLFIASGARLPTEVRIDIYRVR